MSAIALAYYNAMIQRNYVNFRFQKSNKSNINAVFSRGNSLSRELFVPDTTPLHSLAISLSCLITYRFWSESATIFGSVFSQSARKEICSNKTDKRVLIYWDVNSKIIFLD